MTPRKAVRSSLCSIAAAVLLALLVVPVLRASSDPFRAENPGPGSVTIAGKWQFHLGAIPRRARNRLTGIASARYRCK